MLRKLLYGQAIAAVRNELITNVNSISVPALNADGSNLAAVNAARRNRVNTAVLLTLAAPEFLAQK